MLVLFSAITSYLDTWRGAAPASVVKRVIKFNDLLGQLLAAAIFEIPDNITFEPAQSILCRGPVRCFIRRIGPEKSGEFNGSMQHHLID